MNSQAKARVARPQNSVLGNGAGARRAFVSGAIDEFTLGLADPASALTGALQDAARDRSFAKFGDQYGAHLATKRAEDRYDERNYGLERGAGRVVGFGGSLLVGGAAAKAATTAVRATTKGARVAALLARAPRLPPGVNPRGMTTLAMVGGGTAGAAGQGVNDIVQHRMGTPGDYAGAIVGGATGGLATLRGAPRRGGATAGVATSVTQDLLNGRVPSIEGAIEGARAGYLTGAAGSGAGKWGAAAAPSHVKGKMGEAMTGARLVAGGEGIAVTKPRVPIGGRTRTGRLRVSVPDFETKLGRYQEAKLGPEAGLTPNQRILQAQQGANFGIDAWTFSDVGRVVGTGAAGPGAQLGVRSEASYRPATPPRR